MTDDIDLLGLEAVVLRYSNNGRIDCSNGSTFICPLSGGPLRFLHKIFGPSKVDSSKIIEDLFGFRPSDEYIKFMSECNGVTLFDNSFFIYGIIIDLNRSLRLEDQQPISLSTELESSRRRYGSAWRPVGSVTGYEKLFELEINVSGQVRIHCDSGPVRIVESFREMICGLAEFLDARTNERGFIDESRKGMDAELSRFVRSDGDAS